MTPKKKYTYEEKQKIINYIIKEKAYNNLRGNIFWKKLEKTKILKRSWESMKEHFRMKLIGDLKSKHLNISEEERQKILFEYKKSGSHSTKLDSSDKELHNKKTDLVIEIRKSVKSKCFIKQSIIKSRLLEGPSYNMSSPSCSQVSENDVILTDLEDKVIVINN